MKAETVGDQRHADHQEEAQRQHQNRRIAVDERRQRPHGDHHHPDRYDDGYDHDGKMLGHSHGRDDAVDREDDVDHDDLDEAGDEAERRSRLFVIILVILLLGGFSGRFGGYGYGYGHRGIGIVGIILIVLLVLLLMHRI